MRQDSTLVGSKGGRTPVSAARAAQMRHPCLPIQAHPPNGCAVPAPRLRCRPPARIGQSSAESCRPLLNPCLGRRLRRPFRKRSEDVIGSSVADMRSQTRRRTGAGATWLGWRGSGVDVGRRARLDFEKLELDNDGLQHLLRRCREAAISRSIALRRVYTELSPRHD